MKPLVFTFLSCLVVVFGFAQSSNNNQEQQIIQLENKWMNAMMHKDSITLDLIMVANFKLEGLQDLERTVSRATWMMNTMHYLYVGSINFMKIKVEVNNDAAITRASFFWKASFDKEPFTDTAYLVDIWMEKNNRWQVVVKMRSQ